jgi:transposase
MEEIREVVRLWQAGHGIKPVAARLGLDPKTVRRYVSVARTAGVEQCSAAMSEEQFVAILISLEPAHSTARGDAWQLCEVHRERIDAGLKSGLRLTRVRSLLRRDGIELPYSTLHRFASSTLGFGRQSPTIAVLDGEPGHELQVDTGWMTMLEPDAQGKRRRFRAWIFTPSFSRYRFVHPCLAETTVTAIEACEAAWSFYGGVFRVLIPDGTKSIIEASDPLQPRIVTTFLEYSQTRGFVIDPARVRKPQDKARVERSVSYARDSCFAGERLETIEQARERATTWCSTEAGLRLHSRTLRRPREHFLAEEQAALLALPLGTYDIPIRCSPKVARDQYAQVAKSLYSLPKRFVGKILRARADSQTVRFYDGNKLVKTHSRVAPGRRATDINDFPADRLACARRDTAWLVESAASHGAVIAAYTRLLLDVPLPWTRMRRVYALFNLIKKYGLERVTSVCTIALEADMDDIHRLRRMLESPCVVPAAAPTRVVPIARYLHPASQYALPLTPKETTDDARSDQP